MTFVEYEKPYIVQEHRVVPQCEIKFFGGRHYYVAFPDCVFIEPRHANAAVECGDGLSEWPERALQRGFCLRR
jgi:hypothetical protein